MPVDSRELQLPSMHEYATEAGGMSNHHKGSREARAKHLEQMRNA